MEDSFKKKILYAVLGVVLIAMAVVTYAVFAMPTAATFIGFLGALAIFEVL